MANMLVGWGSARFGLLGQPKGVVTNSSLNYAGVATAVAAMVVFAFLKPENLDSKKSDRGNGPQYEKLNASTNSYGFEMGFDEDVVETVEKEEASWTDALSDAQKKIYGFVASVAAGCLYGVNFNPPAYVANHACAAGDSCTYPGMSTDVKDYVFSHFIGIWLMATCFLLAYCVSTKNKPRFSLDAIFPSFVSGLIWASAQVSWFFANSLLGNVIAFPIISIGPGLISAVWGIAVFGELKGGKNMALVGAAFALIAGASTMMALSA
jgi:hypothetical protein